MLDNRVAPSVRRMVRRLGENSLCTLIDAVFDWRWEMGEDGRFTFVSPDLDTLHGIPLSAIQGQGIRQFCAEALDRRAGLAAEAAIGMRRPFRDFVFQIKVEDGRKIWLEIAGAPILDGNGGCSGYRGGGKNVTVEIESVLALRRSERRYREFFETAADWFWETDTTGRFVYVSPNAEAALGLPPCAFEGKALSEIKGMAIEAEREQAILADIDARRNYRNFLNSYSHPNGRVIWVNFSGSPYFGEDGVFRGYRGICRDATVQVETERREQRQKRQLHQLFETTADSYWEQDKKGRLTVLSTSFENSTGIARSEMLGHRLNDVSQVTIDPASGMQTLAAIKARVPYHDLVHTMSLPDGRAAHVRTSGIPMYDENGGYCGYCGVSKDVTAQVEAERALRDSEQALRASEVRLTQLLEASSDHYYEADTKNRVTYISPNYETATGIPATEILGKRPEQNPNVSFSAEMGKMAIMALIARQPYRDLIYSYKFPDGRLCWISLSGAPIFDADGNFQGYRGTGANITKRVEAEQVARLAQRRLHDAVSYVTQPLVVYDAENHAIAFNQAFSDLHRRPNINTPVGHGVSFAELADWQRSVGFYAAGPHDEVVTPDLLLERYQSGQEQTYHLSDGRWMMVAYHRLPSDGRVGLWTDITAIKQAETERRSLEVQLHHAQRLDALGTLAGGAAHEINNALVPVIALAKMAGRKQPEGSRERRNLDLILAGAERARDFVSEILAFSRKENAERPMQDLDLATVLRSALELARATVPTSIRLVAEIEPTPAINGDPNQLRQVIVNMVTNAAQAIGQSQGKIAVTLRPEADGSHLRLSVADSGCGMDEATLARIFEPFFTTKPVGEGVGLGLSVAHGIVKTHGGRIEVKSTPGQGCCFDIFLPLASAS